jgi:hypothetical protein
MDVEPQIINKPKILTWIGGIITGLGILLIPFGVIGAVLSYLKEGENFFLSLYSLYDFVGTAIGICAFGLAVSRGKRWHLFGLLIIVFFGSFLLGLFSMVGKETNIGYYIWAVGGILSASLIAILIIYWDKFLDG